VEGKGTAETGESTGIENKLPLLSWKLANGPTKEVAFVKSWRLAL